MESESGCFGEVLFLMVRQFIGITRRSNGKLVVEVTPHIEDWSVLSGSTNCFRSH